MLNDLGEWMAERVVAQQSHFEASKVTITQSTFGWDSRLIELKRELATAVNDLLCRQTI